MKVESLNQQSTLGLLLKAAPRPSEKPGSWEME